MTEYKLTMLPVEVDGYCDPETGVCAVPQSLLDAGAAAASSADAASPTGDAPAT